MKTKKGKKRKDYTTEFCVVTPCEHTSSGCQTVDIDAFGILDIAEPGGSFACSLSASSTWPLGTFIIWL